MAPRLLTGHTLGPPAAIAFIRLATEIDVRTRKILEAAMTKSLVALSLSVLVDRA